jgi:hypothetical protein
MDAEQLPSLSHVVAQHMERPGTKGLYSWINQGAFWSPLQAGNHHLERYASLPDWERRVESTCSQLDL